MGSMRAGEIQLHWNEFERAAFYGRPLFAVMQKHGEFSMTKDSTTRTTLINRPLHWIAGRMLVGEKLDWDNKSCFSILGTRIQLGEVSSFELSSDLVSNA